MVPADLDEAARDPGHGVASRPAEEDPGRGFTEDWFVHHVPYWQRFFADAGWDPDAPRVAVEIGSFEGRSTVWTLQNLLRHPDSRIHCLDTFEGGVEHHAEQTRGLFDRFRHNLGSRGLLDKAVVHRGPSFDGLSALLRDGVTADFLYVDGSHEATDVLADLVLGFRLLRPGGLLICDDYLWTRDEPGQDDVLSSPKIAIDAFVNIHRREVEFPYGLHNWQFGLRKRARPAS